MSLYHKYRPQKLTQIIGQIHIKQTLINAIKYDLIGHAYLFSGPRGTGKTSIARIMAMAVNCSGLKNKSKINDDDIPCGQCQSCQSIIKGSNLNIIEIDAASNRGIDEIRALKVNINVAIGSEDTKVFIIDEVHMLTKEAFNALLKTLEEPPKQTMFILATTEIHKVPSTIVSRSQHFEFRRATNQEMIQLINQVSRQEKMKFQSDDAWELISNHADGSFRDALSILDQLKSLGEQAIEINEIRMILGIAPEKTVIELLNSSFESDQKTVNQLITDFVQNGYDPVTIINDLIAILQKIIHKIHGISITGSESLLSFIELTSKNYPVQYLITLIEQLILAKAKIRWSPLPFLPLELVLFAGGQHTDPRQMLELVDNKKDQAVSNQDTKIIQEAVVGQPKVIEEQQAKPLDHNLWNKVVTIVREKNTALAALLKASRLGSIDTTKLVIEVPFSFYADRIMDQKNFSIIQDAVKEVFSVNPNIGCQVSTNIKSVSVNDHPIATKDDRLTIIQEVFGNYIKETVEVEGDKQ